MPATDLTKREFIALEILKSLLTTQTPNAVEQSFDLADEFIKTQQTSEPVPIDFTAQMPLSMTDNAPEPTTQKTPPSFPIFNHDYPKNKRT